MTETILGKLYNEDEKYLITDYTKIISAGKDRIKILLNKEFPEDTIVVGMFQNDLMHSDKFILEKKYLEIVRNDTDINFDDLLIFSLNANSNIKIMNKKDYKDE